MIKISKIFGDFVRRDSSLCQGLLPSIRHFENRRGEGPGDEVGPSYWKFNSSLLDDQNYIQLIHSEYPKWISEFSEVKDNSVLWDLIKYGIRQTSIRYIKVIAKNRRGQLLRVKEILKLRVQNVNSDPSEENITKLDEARSEHETL